MNEVFPSAKDALLRNDGSIVWGPDTSIKVALIDLDSAGPTPGSRIIGDLSYVLNSLQMFPFDSYITVTSGPLNTPIPHGLAVGDQVGILNWLGEFDDVSSTYAFVIPNMPALTVISVPNSITFILHFALDPRYSPSILSFPAFSSYAPNSARFFRLNGSVLADELPTPNAIVARSAPLTNLKPLAALNSTLYIDDPLPDIVTMGAFTADNAEFGSVASIAPNVLAPVPGVPDFSLDLTTCFEAMIIYVATPNALLPDLDDTVARVIMYVDRCDNTTVPTNMILPFAPLGTMLTLEWGHTDSVSPVPDASVVEPSAPVVFTI